MKKAFHLLLLLLILTTSAIAQEGKLLRQARKHTMKGEYEQARLKYLELLQQDPAHHTANYEVAVNFFHFTSDQRTASIPYLQAALQNSKRNDTLPEIFFMLGEAHQLAGNNEQALSYYQRFKPYLKNNSEGKELLADLNRKLNQLNHGNAFAISSNDTLLIENLGGNINTIFPEYVPVVNQDESVLMFTSRRTGTTGQEKDYSDEKYFEDMYIARGGAGRFASAAPFRLSDRYIGLVENTPEHDAIVGISADSAILLTFRDEGLWRSELQADGSWAGPEMLGEAINPPKAFTPHGFITADGNQLYFSSERKGGRGGLDLYVSTKGADGHWGAPVALGNNLNTPFDEDSPYLSPDGNRLYFSSRGHNTMGGYDIFVSQLNGGQWSTPENLGMPVNSPADDIFYVPLNEFTGYFSSNRTDGLGDMDIYRVLYQARAGFHDCMPVAWNQTPDGILSITLDEPAAASSITLHPRVEVADGHRLHAMFWKWNDESIRSDQFTFQPDTLKSDSIFLEAISTNQVGLTNRQCYIYVWDPAIGKPPITTDSIPAVAADSLPAIARGPVRFHFGLNQSALSAPAHQQLGELANALKADPSLKVSITGHSDVRGAEELNVQLSEKRAQAVKQYLLKAGVPSTQIVKVSGLGESAPLQPCAEMDCTDEQHALNRRVEVVRIR